MKMFSVVLLLIVLTSCNKEEIKHIADTPMDYIDLEDTIFKTNKPIVLDLNKDNRPDFLFYAELVIARPQDYAELRVVPQIESAVSTKMGEPKAYDKNETIYFNEYTGYGWSEDALPLAQRHYPIELENSYWDGAWKNLQNKYLGVQITKDNKKYNGWIRMSVVTNKGQMILHDAAISKEPQENVTAGKAA